MSGRIPLQLVTCRNIVPQAAISSAINHSSPPPPAVATAFGYLTTLTTDMTEHCTIISDRPSDLLGNLLAFVFVAKTRGGEEREGGDVSSDSESERLTERERDTERESEEG